MPARALRFTAIPVLFALLMMASPSSGEGQSVRPVTFAVMGDTPYFSGDREKLEKNIARLNGDPEIEFLVHVGDIRSGGDKKGCIKPVYT